MSKESALVKQLTAKIECRRDTLPMKPETAITVVRILASDIHEIIRDAVNDARREWLKRSRQE